MTDNEHVVFDGCFSDFDEDYYVMYFSLEVDLYLTTD